MVHQLYPSIATTALHIALVLENHYTTSLSLGILPLSKTVLKTYVKKFTEISSRHLHTSTDVSSRPAVALTVLHPSSSLSFFFPPAPQEVPPLQYIHSRLSMALCLAMW